MHLIFWFLTNYQGWADPHSESRNKCRQTTGRQEEHRENAGIGFPFKYELQSTILRTYPEKHICLLPSWRDSLMPYNNTWHGWWQILPTDAAMTETLDWTKCIALSSSMGLSKLKLTVLFLVKEHSHKQAQKYQKSTFELT